MELDKTVQKVMDTLQANLEDVIERHFSSINTDMKSIIEGVEQKKREEAFLQKRELLEKTLEQKQILLTDSSFRGVGKSTIAVRYAEEQHIWVVRSSNFRASFDNPKIGHFWCGTSRQMGRGLPRECQIVADDITLYELQELYSKDYHNVFGFIRR